MKRLLLAAGAGLALLGAAPREAPISPARAIVSLPPSRTASPALLPAPQSNGQVTEPELLPWLRAEVPEAKVAPVPKRLVVMQAGSRAWLALR